MLVEKSIGENQTRQKRAHRTPQGFPIKRCKICGAEFSPVCAIQRTCSKVCSIENKRILNAQWKIENPERYQAKIEKAKKRYNPSGTCKICGKVINQDFISPTHRSTSQMHDECVFSDCIDTLAKGVHLTKTQIQRLAARGYTMKEFINEYV